MGPGRIGVCLILVVLLPGPAVPGGAAPDPFAACEAGFAAEPEAYESAYCFYSVGQKQKLLGEGAQRVGNLLARDPDNQWLRLVLGHFQWRLDPEGAEETYFAAAEGFRARGEADGEVLARYNLARYLMDRGRLAEAGRQVDRVMEVADQAQDRILMARAFTLRARQLRFLGHDLATAYYLLLQAEAKVFPHGPPRLQSLCLLGLGNACYLMGRFDEALGYHQRREVLAREAGDTYTVASCKYNIALARLWQTAELPRLQEKEELLQLFQDARTTAAAAGNRRDEAQSHRHLGNLLGRTQEGRDRARWHYERCLDIARESRRPATLTECLVAKAGHFVRWNPEDADHVLHEAQASAQKAANPRLVAKVKWQRMRASWATGSREEAIADSFALLAAIEDLTDRQASETGRARVFSVWTDPYYWLSGRLLDSPQAPPLHDDLELAFSLTERLRARLLLDALSNARATPPEETERSRLAEARRKLVRLQRQLLDLDLTADERSRTLAELALVEHEEAALGQAPAEAGLRRPSLATLAQVEESLAANEAMLLFQVGLWKDLYGDFVGGAWLLVATRGGTRVYRLPDRVRLREALPFFRDLILRRDGSEADLAASLHGELLEEALADLDPQVERLVIVPDGYLHFLPFAALRPATDAAPLVASYQLSVVPSATLWLRWRQRQPTTRSSVLALADPLPPGQSRGGRARQRQSALATGTRLERLPQARKEGRAAVRYLGGRLLAGAEATEHALKQTDLDPFGILHFAAHAVIDERYSQRSAVVLAPGAEGEDGLLQPRDVVELDLDGRVVVLSACQSAWGEVLRGEGVMSLARSFFEAGAEAVVGSLWPLRDDETAALFDAFYRHLAAGRSVAAALREAQEDLLRAGAPAEAWAGVVVLGNGDLVPVPGGRPTPPLPPWLWVLAGGLGAGALLAVVLMAGRGRRRPRPTS